MVSIHHKKTPYRAPYHTIPYLAVLEAALDDHERVVDASVRLLHELFDVQWQKPGREVTDKESVKSEQGSRREANEG